MCISTRRSRSSETTPEVMFSTIRSTTCFSRTSRSRPSAMRRAISSTASTSAASSSSRGGEVERRRARGDPAGALDELHQRPGEVAGEAPAHGDQQGEEARRHQEALPPQLGELARGLLLLREERHGEEEALRCRSRRAAAAGA